MACNMGEVRPLGANRRARNANKGLAFWMACAMGALALCMNPFIAERVVAADQTLLGTQGGKGEEVKNFNIPAQSLDSALEAFYEQSGVQVAYSTSVVKGIKTQGVSGDYTPEQALKELLTGTELTYTFTDANTVTVKSAGIKKGKYLPPVVVTATRSEESLTYVPGSVTVIEAEDIQQQREASQSLSDVLAKMVPGLGPSSQTRTNTAQTLRGRDILVLLDGVPLNTTRDGSRDLFNIDPSAIERIEVVRGSTPIYGNGATGGIIHIFTKKQGKGEVQWRTRVQSDFSMTHFADSIHPRVEQGVMGQAGKFDFNFSISADRTAGFFDAEGDRIPPEPSQGDLSDTRTFNLFGKIGSDLDENQRLQFTLNYLNAEQNTDYVSDPAVNAFPLRSVKAKPQHGLFLQDQPATRNLVANLDYIHKNLLGSYLRSQIYFRDYFTSFFPFDGRPFSAWNNIAQTRIESYTLGGRLSLETPLSLLDLVDMTLLWGTDYRREDTKQPVSTFDGTTFDNSGGKQFVKTGDRTFVPPIAHHTVGVFGQVEWPVLDQLLVRTGLRFEYIKADVESFTTLGQSNFIQGGSVDYSATVFNAGLVYIPVDPIELFFNFSQGFSLPDIGLRLRGAAAGFQVTESNLQPLKVDNYEAGIRGSYRGFNGGVSVFYTESDLGVTSGGFNLTIIRAPERTYGVEADAVYRFNQQWRLGGTFTWIEGENDADQDGDYTALNSLRIPPVKITGFLEYNPFDWLRTRLQTLYFGSRTRAFEDGVGFGGRVVNEYMVADLLVQADIGPGTLQVGVENLFNNQYFPLFSQQLRNGQNTSHLAARGATMSVSYSWKW